MAAENAQVVAAVVEINMTAISAVHPAAVRASVPSVAEVEKKKNRTVTRLIRAVTHQVRAATLQVRAATRLIRAEVQQQKRQMILLWKVSNI